MNTDNWGKFTVRGSEKVEKLIRKMISEIAEICQNYLEKENYDALVLIGGYGRSEGGVVITENKEKPHNNFDFVLLTKNLNERQNAETKKNLMKELQPVIKKIGIGIDLSVLSAQKLKTASCRIIWYDMRFGHKTILGDPDFVPSLKKFTVERIPDWDARNLMVNRGTLMIINDLLLQKEQLDEKFKKLIVKHIVKAIIGYGDTLLYFLHDYNWSYLEKQKRMRKNQRVEADFKKIYDEAMNFRFQPDYNKFLQKDFLNWMDELRTHFEKIFLFCEARRLHRPDLNWKNYAESAFKFALTEEITKFKPFAKKILNLLRNQTYPQKSSLVAKLGFKTLGMAGILPILFPLFAYHLKERSYLELAAGILSSSSKNFPELREAYLRQWGKTGDVNFDNMLKKYEISLER